MSVLPFLEKMELELRANLIQKYYSYNNKESSIDMSKSHQINGDHYPSLHAPTDLQKALQI